MQVRGVGEVIGGPAEIILGFRVVKALNYVSGALNSLLILLQLDVGERWILEAVQHYQKSLFVELSQLVKFKDLIVASENTAALLRVSQHIEILLPEVKFQHFRMILRGLLQTIKLFWMLGSVGGRLRIALLVVFVWRHWLLKMLLSGLF